MKNIKRLIILLAVALVLLATGCQSIDRGIKDIGSSVSGLERTLKVYSYDGELLHEYSGKFDISENSDGTKIKFDLSGKRVMIYNAIVVVEED